MLRRTVLTISAALAAAGLSTLSITAANGSAPVGAQAPALAAGHKAESQPGTHAGPPYKFTTELMGPEGEAIPLKDKGMLTRTKLGYRWWTGQQDNHVVITLTPQGWLHFTDTGTKHFKKLAKSCHKLTGTKGVAANCRVPRSATDQHPLLLEIWPRLGNDYVNTAALPARFATTMLTDEGNDTAHFGAGPDFFNGYLGVDRVWGGGGNDWIRGGPGNDWVYAGAGDDDVVTDQGADHVRGDAGNDRLWTGDGNDALRGGRGADHDVCGNGRDKVTVDSADRVAPKCESVSRR